ncbi:MAG: helix-turn-helix domain-containing protein [Candidatus Omnitrophica bacterium]|nr:helix-turn-helix domain-containing protein [Candidatus Omnitrophota bacterium]
MEHSLKDNFTSTISEDYLTTTQAAELCHVTRFTVLNWIKQGKLRAFETIGGHQRIPKKVILALVEKSNSSVSQHVPKAHEAASGAAISDKIDEPVAFEKGAYVLGQKIASIKNRLPRFLRGGV